MPSNGADSDISTAVPLIHVTSQEHKQSQDAQKSSILPELPSHKYRFTIWHELRNTQVTGDQLRAPRVREGPETKQDTFYTLKDGDHLVHHDKKGGELVAYRNKQENWESALLANLSCQQLSDAYQRENFFRILRRLKSAEKVVLIDDHLHDMSGFSFPRCRVLNLTNNYLVSFKQLPRAPLVRHLVLSYNQINSLDGLDRLKNLEALEMFGNGVCFSKSYRYRVFKALPNLMILDNVLKQESDTQPPPTEHDGGGKGNMCIIL